MQWMQTQQQRKLMKRTEIDVCVTLLPEVYSRTLFHFSCNIDFDSCILFPNVHVSEECVYQLSFLIYKCIAVRELAVPKVDELAALLLGCTVGTVLAWTLGNLRSCKDC